MYKPTPRRAANRSRSTRRGLLLVALGACQPRSAAPPFGDAAPAATVLADAAPPVIAEAAPTDMPLTDAGPPEPRTLYLGPRASLAAVCADADAWYAKVSRRPRSRVCLRHGPRTLPGGRFLEAADYSVPSPSSFSERPANQYEPFLALRTTRGWFAQPIGSFPQGGGGRNVWIPLERIAERDGELVVIHLEARNGQTEERELRCALSDAGVPSCTSFAPKAGVAP